MPKKTTKKNVIAPKKWDVDDLLKQLEKIYLEKKNDNKAWDDEKDNLKLQLQILSESLHGDYQDPKVLDRGGSGVILKISYVRLHNQIRVLKFPRPLPQDAPEFAELLDKEIKLLAEVRFRSIVTIFEAGKLPSSTSIAGLKFVPFYIMDFIDGSDSDEYFKKNETTFEKFINILSETVKAIKHLHDNNIVHMDIKPGNIRIDKSNHPVLVDLGTTKIISNEDSETKVATTIRYAPQEVIRNLIQDPKDQSRAEGKFKRSDIKLAWDLHFLGLTIQEWLEIILKKDPLLFSAYQRKYLYLLSLRMLQDPYDQSKLNEFGLPVNLLYEIQFKQISNVEKDVNKIQPESDLASTIPEFDQNHHVKLQIGKNESLTLTDRVAKTINHSFMRRLAEISQLGIVQLVYPTSTHSRLEHSLGTYFNVIKYIRALYFDSLNPLFRQMMEPRNLRAALLSALLHDIGQFPMAHDLEDIDKKMFNHALLVSDMIKGKRDRKSKGSTKMIFPTMDDIYTLWDVSKQEVLSILEAKIDSPTQGIRERILKSLISGPIDADKLDYLLRDANRLNVPYPEGIDVERLVSCLTILIKTHANGVLGYVVVHEKGRVPAEFLVLSRYAMFSQVYWHHSVRAAKSMLARAVRSLLDKLSTDEKKNIFRSSFEKFVLFQLGYRHNEQDLQLPLFNQTKKDIKKHDKNKDKKRYENNLSGIALNSWDIQTLIFIRNSLADENVPEYTMIDDILNRKFYKRAYIFDAENNRNVWDGLINQWDNMKSEDKVAAERKLENAILSSIDQKISQNPDTLYLTNEQRESLEIRIKAGLPVITIDVPSHKPGSRKTLEYILEEDRRSLRKSNRICGSSYVDTVWREYADKLRENAGRIRVFVHPDYVDIVLSAVDKSWVGDNLENLAGL